MRIISDFRDYYDSLMGMGQDLDLQYLRHQKSEKFKGNFPKLDQNWPFTSYHGLNANYYIVGFCGKVYAIIKLAKPHRTGPALKATCLNLEEVDSFVEEHFKKDEIAAYRSNKYQRNWLRPKRRDFQRFFEAVEKARDKYSEIFLQHHTPIFVIDPQGWKEGGTGRRYPKITYNACLKAYDFVRIFDPYTAFQEIQMFLGGLASPEKPIPEVSDKDMLLAKGFDAKSSFRKPPGKKKKKK